jgi:hypothetical protein
VSAKRPDDSIPFELRPSCSCPGVVGVTGVDEERRALAGGTADAMVRRGRSVTKAVVEDGPMGGGECYTPP